MKIYEYWVGRSENIWVGRSENIWVGRSENIRAGRSENIWVGRSENIWEGRSENIWAGRCEQFGVQSAFLNENLSIKGISNNWRKKFLIWHICYFGYRHELLNFDGGLGFKIYLLGLWLNPLIWIPRTPLTPESAIRKVV